MDEHVPGVIHVTGGIMASCRCGWRSDETFEDTNEGHDDAHLASHRHVADATGSPPPGRANDPDGQ